MNVHSNGTYRDHDGVKSAEGADPLTTAVSTLLSHPTNVDEDAQEDGARSPLVQPIDGHVDGAPVRADGRPTIGHTAGAFDMFHIGHLNVLRRARQNCDRLVVGVSTDELIMSVKGKRPVVPLEERMEIVAAIRYVDQVVVQEVIDKRVAWELHRFDRLFVGDDHVGEPMWERLEREFPTLGVDIVYLSYTRHTSSTLLRERLLAMPGRSDSK